MKIRDRLSQSSCKIEIQEGNKQEIIHEDDNEDEEQNSEDDDDDDDLDEVFGHKNAIRNKATAGNSTKHGKKQSLSDLKLNVEGPIRFNNPGGNSIMAQRVPQSATQPSVKGLGLNMMNPSQKGYGHVNQIYSPTYPQFHNPFGNQSMMVNREIQMNQYPAPQMMAAPHMPAYGMHPMYPSHQPQSAGLARKPPGFEFMNPKSVNPGYNEYPQYVMPVQNPYYINKQSASPMIPSSSGYDMAMLKKQPQSATMMNYKVGENSLVLGAKTKAYKAPQVSSVDQQESNINEYIKECEKTLTFDEKLEVLHGKLCEMLFTQTGSRYIQRQLSDENSEEPETIEDMKARNEEKRAMIQRFTSFILEEIGDKVNELMIDRYGNYFFQELIRK
mmetsp:Transcript_12342/g.14102  ORF Transcript_12342/g.14102 Transcript_12342/m.14102 type:complete len:387 (-) Transcript_12342:1467-2627(-)